MDKTSSSLPPIILLQFLHMAFPQFAEKSDQGQYLQQVRDHGVDTALHNQSLSIYLFFSSFSQDANECWLQMMRVLQQKLDPLESDTPMEVKPALCFISHPSEGEIFVKYKVESAPSLTLKCDLPNCRQTLRAAPPPPVRRRT